MLVSHSFRPRDRERRRPGWFSLRDIPFMMARNVKRLLGRIEAASTENCQEVRPALRTDAINLEEETYVSERAVLLVGERSFCS